MFEEYLAHYKEYQSKFNSKLAIFLMVGVFYEMYDVRNPETGESNTSFLEVVELLGLKVSVKKGEGPGGLDGLVAGIPEGTIHKWAGRLTSLGWTVILVDQVKDQANKVIKRKVERILTPGSHIEAATSADMFLTFVSIFKGKDRAPSIAVTALDLTTGHLHTFETDAKGTEEAWTSNEIVQFMELYPPREVLWSTDSLQDSLNEQKLRGILGCPTSTTFHRRAPLNSGAWLIPAYRDDYLRSRSGLKTLLPTNVALHISPGSHCETTLISLLCALEELWPSMKLGNLLVFPWIPGSILRLGENALVQLHMIVTDSSRSDVLSLFDRCASPMGHRGLRERLLKPSADPRIISDNLNLVEIWTKKTIEYRMDIVKRLRTISDLHRLYRKLQQGTITATDLMGLDTSLKAMEWISKSENIPVKELQEIRTEVFKIFSVDKVYESSDDSSLFAIGVVPELDTLERQIQEQYQLIQSWITKVSSNHSISADSLKIEFKEKSLVIKGPRAVIQICKNSGKLPGGSTAVLNKGSSYLESSELDNVFFSICKLRDSLSRSQSIALVEQGTILASTIFMPWMSVTNSITQIDVNLTLARVALDLGYIRPEIIEADEGYLQIEGLRHPLLEAQDKRVSYVQHDIALKEQGWLLYGLNASGKSSLMRATGLATLLAQGGSFVPASKMCLAPFKSLHTRIINTDNLWLGLSSFAVEMSEMRDIFREAGPKSLVLGDELCSGTETTSATALVAAGLKGLLKRGAKFLFATHLHGLSQLTEVSQDPSLRIRHLHVEYDSVKDKLIYHRTLRDGPGSSLYGLEVAKAMRLPDDILEDAVRFRKLLCGQTELSSSVGSSWNSSVVRDKCTNCGSDIINELEVHHIRERNEAINNQLEDGSNVHRAANLAVVCAKCHDKIHSGNLSLGPLTMTSDGPERSEVGSIASVSVNRKSKWTKEQEELIHTTCKRFPTLTPGHLSKYLLNQHDIQISSGSINKFRNL